MLAKKVLENEAFNDLKKKKPIKAKKRSVAIVRRNKKARCYICKQRGHTYWTCANRKKLAGIKRQPEENNNDLEAAERVQYKGAHKCRLFGGRFK